MRNLAFVVVILAGFNFFVAPVWAVVDSENPAKLEAYNRAVAFKQEVARASFTTQAATFAATCGTLEILFAIYHQNEEIIQLLKESNQIEKDKKNKKK